MKNRRLLGQLILLASLLIPQIALILSPGEDLWKVLGTVLVFVLLAVGILSLDRLSVEVPDKNQEEGQEASRSDDTLLIEHLTVVEDEAEELEGLREVSDHSGVRSLTNDIQEMVAGIPSQWDDSGLAILSEVKMNSDFVKENIARAYEISDNLANTAKQAFELSEHVQNGVKLVTDTLSASLENTRQLFEQSKKITKILEIMSDISAKIHVLSINASIVSARAGTSGKGFEVVAKEIRGLAKGTENSLLDIENVIKELQTTIGHVIDKVQTATTEAESEKNSLMSVAGSLQGVILAVEIIRAVTSVAKDKSEEQSQSLQSLSDAEASPQQKITQLLIPLGEALESLKKLQTQL